MDNTKSVGEFSKTEHLDGKVTLYGGDNRDVLRSLPDNSIDSIVTDPPYALVSIVKRFGGANAAPAQHGTDGAYARASSGFMGKKWDTGEVAFSETFWAECLRVLKPGGHVVAFSGTRTYHRMAVAIEDAGFEIRDQLAWAYGSGFPKSHDVAKQMDKSAGHWRGKAGAVTIESQVAKGTEYERTDKGEPITDAARQWQGWGTALKPAWEPICLARKPLAVPQERPTDETYDADRPEQPVRMRAATVAANVLEHGTGALNIDGCRVGDEERFNPSAGNKDLANRTTVTPITSHSESGGRAATGRWPANIVHDGSDEVLAGFPHSKSGALTADQQVNGGFAGTVNCYGTAKAGGSNEYDANEGSAARFFACFPIKDEFECTHSNANSAESTFSLSSELVVSVLSNAVEQSMPGRALNSASYQAPSTTVTESELSRIAESVTIAIQSIAKRFLHESQPESFTLTDSLACIAATQSQTDTITITISPLISSGFAEPVTFNITATNSELGAPDSRPRRLFYSSKADKLDRIGSKHPTVKPVDLMQWLCRLVTPPGGLVLDPFAGSGSTGEAAWREGFRAILIEREEEYQADIAERLRLASAGPMERKARAIKQADNDNLPLFGGAETGGVRGEGRQIYGHFADQDGRRVR